MQCSIQGCTGEYEDQDVVHTVAHGGQTIVIEGVPAEVCSVCGDTLLSPETVHGIEGLLKSHEKPIKTAPVFEFSASSENLETA